MRLFWMLLGMTLICASGYSATWYVPDDFPAGIQAAIDTVANGDTIIVKPGTYVENIDFLGKAITLRAEQGTNATIIDGSQAGSVVTCQIGEGADSVLDGFTITNGYADYGGGMRNESSSPTIINCTFSVNSALYAGGMYNEYSSPSVNNCTFSENVAFFDNKMACEGGYGGGIYNYKSSPTINDTLFFENQANGGASGGHGGTWRYGSGGGMYNYESNPTVNNCTFSCNSSFHGPLGGGMNNTCSNPTVDHCFFANNSCPGGCGGGMYNVDCTPKVTNCTFSENKAERGGGMYIDYYSNPTVTNCTFVRNFSSWASGILIDSYSTLTMTGSTFFENDNNNHAGAALRIEYYSSATVTNSILWNDIPDEIYVDHLSTISVAHSNVKGGFTGPGNIYSNPLFVDADNGDFHLTFNSPCRGSGDNTAVTELTDFEGDPRIAYGTVDMGADEFHPHLYWMGDASPGGTVEVKLVGLPGTGPVFLCVGSGVLGAPIPTLYGDWYLDFPLILTLGMGSIVTPEGVSELPFTLDSGFPAMEIPMQSLIGMELTNLCVMEVQ